MMMLAPPLRLGKLEPPAIVLGIDMSRYNLFPALDDPLGGKIERRRVIGHDDECECHQPSPAPLRLFPVLPLSHVVVLPHG